MFPLRPTSFLFTLPCVLALTSLVPAASASTIIDFDPLADNAPSTFSGGPTTPLTVGIATFTGGELLHAEAGLLNPTGVYASHGVFGSDTNPIHIQFSMPVDQFSVYVLNGENTQTYTITDNLGDRMSASAASAGAGGFALFTLPGLGITSADIASGNADAWNFAIDRVSFSETPEPASFY